MVFKNYKYSKSLSINILRCNHLLIKTNKIKIMSFFFNTRLARIFFFFFFYKLEHSH